MDKLKNYDVAFSGLKNGKHEFNFEIREAFFQLFDVEQEFKNPQINAHVLLDKHSTFLEFLIKITGNVELVCDISGEEFQHPLENEIKVLVKFGEDYDDSDEEIMTIPHNSYSFNVAQLIYEDVVLSIPMKKVSPNISEKDLELLNQYSPSESEDVENEEESNPMWEALKKLKDNN